MADYELKAEKILEIHVKCTPGLDVGEGPEGFLCVIPIVGGTFEGRLKGKVIPGGADWNTRKNRGAHVFAKYLLQADDGEFIAIENEGMLESADMDACIKTLPRFTAREDGPYAWLNYGVYVGGLRSGSNPGEVEITVYKMK